MYLINEKLPKLNKKIRRKMDLINKKPPKLNEEIKKKPIICVLYNAL